MYPLEWMNAYLPIKYDKFPQRLIASALSDSLIASWGGMYHHSAWNNRRSSVTVGHDFMCDRQDSFSAGHNDWQVLKI